MRRRRFLLTAAAALVLAGAGAGTFTLTPHGHDLIRTLSAGAASITSPTAPTSPAAGDTATAAAGSALVQEPDDGMNRIYQVITGAKHTVTMTMYELQDDTAVQDLIAAHQRGVQVRVLLDQAFHGRRANTDAYGALEQAGVAVKWTPKNVIVHQKTITADAGTPGQVAAIGTGNLQTHYYPSTWDAWLLDTAPSQVAAIAGTFDADWTAAPGKIGAAVPADGLLWSPNAKQTYIADVAHAHTSIQVSSEELGDRDVVQAIAGRARAGVTCQVLMTDQASWHAALTALEGAGCQVHVFPDRNGVLYVHEKQLIIDATSDLLGSQNIGTGSLTYNRELSVRITDPALVRQAVATFAARFGQAQPWTP